MSGFIEDGYDQEGFIKADSATGDGRSRWDDLNFKYRQGTRSELVVLDAEVERTLIGVSTNPQLALAAEKLVSAWMAKHVIQWDLKNRGGHPVAINEENMMRVHHQLFNLLYGIVRGTRMSDAKPFEEPPGKTLGEMQGN